MTALPFGNVTVTVQRATVSQFGDATYTDHHQIQRCAFAPSFSNSGRISRRAESTAGGGDMVTDSRTLFVAAGSDVRPTDRILIHPPGVDVIPADDRVTRKENAFEVLGQPMPWSNALTGWSPGVEIGLVRVY